MCLAFPDSLRTLVNVFAELWAIWALLLWSILGADSNYEKQGVKEGSMFPDRM